MALLFFAQSAGVYVVYGLSTDTKPSSPSDNSLFIETDTANIYLAAGNTWTLPTKQKNIRTLADFPTPVNGAISLEDNITYIIIGTVNIGTNTILAGIRNAFVGLNRLNDKLIGTTTNTLITVDSAGVAKLSFICDEVGLQCPNGTLFDVIGTGLALLNVSISSTKNCGNIDTCPSFTIRNSGIQSGVTNAGFTFSGTSTGICQIRDNVLLTNTGVLFALGSSVFRTFSISRNNIKVNTGQTFLSGTGAANVSVAATLDDNIFDGAGTYVSGITASDNRWTWTNNFGLSDTPSDGGTTGIDGGEPATVYGGTTPIDGGSP